MTSLPFDTITLVDEAGPRLITVHELKRLPLNARVAAILEQRIQFFLGEASVDVGLALKALRTVAKE